MVHSPTRAASAASLTAGTAAAAKHSVVAQDAALMAVLADSGGGTDETGSEKHLSASDLWLFGEE
jgi:hypothetical protein